MRDGGFPVDDEDVLETMARMLAAAGETEAASLIRSGRCKFEWDHRDNWNGGTDCYVLRIAIAAENFVAIGDRKTALEGVIVKRLEEAASQFGTDWYSVALSPMIVSMPGRPDLEGGPVSYSVRRAIIDLLRQEDVPWRGELSDVDFLAPVFDLDVMPSHDSQFKTAGQDIWQHRVNNPEDWPDDWIFTDERFNLLGGPDVTFLAFVERLVAPKVRPDRKLASAMVQRMNEELRRTSWTLVERETLAGDIRYRAEPFEPVLLRSLQTMRASAAILSSSWMHQELERIEAAIDTDPALAIGTAKEMVETCCKHIVDALNIPLPANPDMPDLTKAVLKALKLVPEGISDEAKGAETIKRTLSSLGQITKGLAELRKLYGTGHGRSSVHRGLTARHARLAVNSASAFVEFVSSTYLARKTPMPQDKP